MKKTVPIVLLILAAVGAMSVGSSQIDGFWSVILNPGSNEIVWQIRFPRVMAALIVGAALGIAGLMAQGACNNAVAEPAILGTAAGASFGAVIGIATGLVQVGSLGALACGTAGALLATSITFRLAALRGALSSFNLIIVGIAVSAIFTSLVGITSAVLNRADARSISFWSLGSLALVTNENLIGIIITTLAGGVIAWSIAPKLDRLSLGDQSAFHLGVNVPRVRFLAFVWASKGAEALIASMEQDLSAASVSNKPRVAFLYLRGTSSVYLIGGPGSGADSLLDSVGAIDVGAQILDRPFNTLTAESLATLNPDVILVMSKGLESVGGVQGLIKLPGVAQTKAGKNSAVIDVDDSLLLSFGPRTPSLLEQLVKGLKKVAP